MAARGRRASGDGSARPLNRTLSLPSPAVFGGVAALVKARASRLSRSRVGPADGRCPQKGASSLLAKGLNALTARVKVRGLEAIDKRSAPAGALLAWRGELITDLGGDDAVSAQERAVVELAVPTKLYVDSLDAGLLEQPSLVLKRRLFVLPVLVERQRLADSPSRLLGQLARSPIPPAALACRPHRSGREAEDSARGRSAARVEPPTATARPVAQPVA